MKFYGGCFFNYQGNLQAWSPRLSDTSMPPTQYVTPPQYATTPYMSCPNISPNPSMSPHQCMSTPDMSLPQYVTLTLYYIPSLCNPTHYITLLVFYPYCIFPVCHSPSISPLQQVSQPTYVTPQYLNLPKYVTSQFVTITQNVIPPVYQTPHITPTSVLAFCILLAYISSPSMLPTQTIAPPVFNHTPVCVTYYGGR